MLVGTLGLRRARESCLLDPNGHGRLCNWRSGIEQVNAIVSAPASIVKGAVSSHRSWALTAVAASGFGLTCHCCSWLALPLRKLVVSSPHRCEQHESTIPLASSSTVDRACISPGALSESFPSQPAAHLGPHRSSKPVLMMNNRDDSQRPHVCTKKGCGKSFIWKHDLVRHARLHKFDPKRFFCAACEASFSRKHDVTRHQNSSCPVLCMKKEEKSQVKINSSRPDSSCHSPAQQVPDTEAVPWTAHESPARGEKGGDGHSSRSILPSHIEIGMSGRLFEVPTGPQDDGGNNLDARVGTSVAQPETTPVKWADVEHPDTDWLASTQYVPGTTEDSCGVATEPVLEPLGWEEYLSEACPTMLFDGWNEGDDTIY